MKRKNIAVCVTGYNWEYESRIVKGISDECAKLDINLLIFATLILHLPLNMDRVLPDSVVKGETEIFNLINYDIIDGIIMLGDSMIEERVIFEVADKAAQKNIPVVNVSDPTHKLSETLFSAIK